MSQLRRILTNVPARHVLEALDGALKDRDDTDMLAQAIVTRFCMNGWCSCGN